MWTLWLISGVIKVPSLFGVGANTEYIKLNLNLSYWNRKEELTTFRRTASYCYEKR